MARRVHSSPPSPPPVQFNAHTDSQLVSATFKKRLMSLRNDCAVRDSIVYLLTLHSRRDVN
jgi:hypothetical protein